MQIEFLGLHLNLRLKLGTKIYYTESQLGCHLR